MKNFFRSMGAFVRALPHFLLFELLYKLILLAIGAPVLAMLLKITMKAAGVGYISDESLSIYLHSPVTIFVVAILLFCAGFFTFVELTALAACFTCYSKNEPLTVGGMLLTGLKGFKKAFRGSGILKFLGFMACMPLAEFTLSSAVFSPPLMPILRRIFSGISGNVAVAAYILLQLLFICIIVSRSYSLHYLVLTEKSFPDCVLESRRKIRRKKAKMTFSFLLWTLFIFAVMAGVTFVISFVTVLFIKGFSKPESAFRTTLYVLRYTLNIFTAVSAFFSAPAIMCWLTGRFLGDLGEDEQIVLPDRNRRKMEKKKKTILIISLATASLMLNVGYIRAVYKGNVLLNAGILNRTQISAHRGFSSVAPENTIYAFEAAMDSSTDYIELDVQLTADGQVVVFHDETLNRTTDGSGRLRDFTYAELQQLSSGSWYGSSGEFADAKIMLLSDVLELVGRKKLLNIEIKNIGNVTETAEKTVELLEEYNLTGSCYVTSFSYNALKNVKQLNSKIKTALIVNMAMSASYAQLPYIDAVSVNYIFVNQSVVNTVHQNGKRIFVWTVDRHENIEQMVALGVDNIITNRPDRAAEVIYSKSVGDTVLKILEMLFGN